MKIRAFSAQADLVGRRVRIRWELVPEGEELINLVPHLRVRRKQRDFDFPPVVLGGPDAYQVYDTAAGLPAGVRMIELPSWTDTTEDLRIVYTATSISIPFRDRYVEVLRRTDGIAYNLTGSPLYRSIEVLDLGGYPGGLLGSAVYYYRLCTFDSSITNDPTELLAMQATALVTENYGYNRFLYDQIPLAYRNQDKVSRPQTIGSDTIPEAASASGQLQRFIDLFGITLDSLRGTAESLRGLHDIDDVDYRYLPLLANHIGWQLSQDVEIPLQRNELKNASRLYGSIGTLPNIRAIIGHYSGWSAQIAEFGQHLFLSNHLPQYNLFAIIESNGEWRGFQDASVSLGFPPGNRGSVGTTGKKAELKSASKGPFALRPGMELSLTVDSEVPITIRFTTSDFANIAAATAVEVAAVLLRLIDGITASADPDGHLVLQTSSTGPTALLGVGPSATSLVSLIGAPTGLLRTVSDSQGALRLFFTASELFPSRFDSNQAAALPTQRRPSIFQKTFFGGCWNDARPVSPGLETAASAPAVATLDDGQLLLVWVSEQLDSRGQLRMALGSGEAPHPARLIGTVPEPFALTDGAQLAVRGSFSGIEKFAVRRADYKDIARASATEVAKAMTAQCPHLLASAAPGGTLLVQSRDSGPQARLRVDLSASNTARVLGLGGADRGAAGSFEDQIRWTTAQHLPEVAPGLHADLCALAVPGDGVRLFGAEHHAGAWQVQGLYYDGLLWAATADGIRGGKLAAPDIIWSSLPIGPGGLPSKEVRQLCFDADGILWCATDKGVAAHYPDGSVKTFSTAEGLPSEDIREVRSGPDGSLWFATAAGLVCKATDGVISVYDDTNTPDGIPSKDIRRLAGDYDGTLWIITPAGIGLRTPAGRWQKLALPAELATVGVEEVAFSALGQALLRSGGAVFLRDPEGAIRPWPGLDKGVQALRLQTGRDGQVVVVTKSGLVVQFGDGTRLSFDARSAVPTGQISAIHILPGGSVCFAIEKALFRLTPDGMLQPLGKLDATVRSLAGPWSLPQVLARGSGGCREPCAVRDDKDRVWLFYSQRQGTTAAGDSWLLCYRRFDPTSRSWEPETMLTKPPLSGPCADQEPGALALPGQKIRVFFRSLRSGGPSLWSLILHGDGTVESPTACPEHPAADVAPAPVLLGDGQLMLIYRSDRSLALSQLGPPMASLAPSAEVQQSARLPEPASLRRFSGSTTALPTDLTRARQWRLLGDLMNYTPNRPLGDPLAEDELYTPHTLGLYVERGTAGRPLTPLEAQRVRRLLEQALPANQRAVIVLQAGHYVEDVYSETVTIGERYEDQYPFADSYPDDFPTDGHAAQWRDRHLLHSNKLGDVSADPTDLSSLRGRTYYPQPE